MSRNRNRVEQVNRLLKWIHKYPGWWFLVCTPNDEHMNPQMMKSLVEQLAKENFYEIIVALLMIHRNEQFMKSALGGLFLDLLMAEMRSGKRDEIINNLIKHLE